MRLREEFPLDAPAIVLAEGKFGEPEGKTANGVVMHSEVFEAAAIVDSTKAGETAADVLNRADVPPVDIVASVEEALEIAPDAIALVIGVAPAGGALPPDWIEAIELAIEGGCSVVSGLHTFFSDDETWVDLAADNDVGLYDVRKPPTDQYRVADGSVDDVDAPIVLTLGIDCASGKRTTTYELYREASDRGYDAGWVATGQTGVMIGAHAGIALDRVPSDFVAGLVEQMIVDIGDDHDIIFVEGQGSLTHRAYSGVTLSILHGSWPDRVVLAVDPHRNRRVLFEQWPIDGPTREIDLIEQLSEAEVSAISTWDGMIDGIDLPTGNVYAGEADIILDGIEATL